MIKVSEYIAEFLIRNGIDTIFTVVGGGAMHLNDSFGHNNGLKCIYQHHEQACAMAAEGYARINNKVAAICVTSGPGAINALTGVCGAYQDSIPMLIFSGQVKTALTIRNSGLNLRTLGGQEFDIVTAVGNMTKYAEMVVDPIRIRFCLEKALYLATSGRPGPCWIDIPIDIQGALIEEKELVGYNHRAENEIFHESDYELIDKVLDRLRMSTRPVLYAGNGIRLSGALEEFRSFISQTGIPVVTCWDSIDLIETDDNNYAGRGGIMGNRAGNFAVQNSDLVLAVGNRLSVYQVGYSIESWAREAFVIDVDIDSNELKKPTLRVDMPICMDAKLFLGRIVTKTRQWNKENISLWKNRCQEWKQKYPVVQKRHYNTQELVNVYAFIDTLSRKCGKDSVTVVSNGSASVVGSQTYFIDKGQRFIMNCALSSMGYGLPAAIGASYGRGKKNIICIEGDGSIQMNIQELQTVVTNKVPIKLFVINNGGYHQIRLTQNNIFHNGLVGVGPESGDLEFPDFEKIAAAYGLPYIRIDKNSDLECSIDKALEIENYCLCEVMCTKDQIFEPKSSTKRLADGTLISPPLEDMAPFLPREELRENMIISIGDENG